MLFATTLFIALPGATPHSFAQSIGLVPAVWKSGSSISRSSDRSATSFFSLTFSSSSGFTRRILVRQQAVIPLLSIEVGDLGDPGLAAKVRNRDAVTTLLKNERLPGV